MDVVDKEQLDVAKALAPLMERVSAAFERAEKSQVSQIEHMQKMADIMKSLDAGATMQQMTQVNTSVKKLIDKIGDLSKTNQQVLSDMAKKATTVGESMSTLTTKVNDTQNALEGVDKVRLQKILSSIEESDGAMNALRKTAAGFSEYVTKKYPATGIIFVTAMGGLWQGLKNTVAIGRSAISLFGGIVDSLVNIAGAIIAIPFKMLAGLIDIANSASGGSNELLQAIENIRKEFGALTQVGPQAIKSMATHMKGFAATGLSVWRVFGNIAMRLEEFLKLSQEMGATFENFASEFSENGGALVAWQKGLGLSGEMMGTIAKRALTFGGTMSKQLMLVQKQALDMGTQFGVASKHISRDMVQAMADVKHFAGATTKEIAQASVYARKLGFELEKITGTLDAFETFDSAAENASKLSQSFGVTVDAFKMMEAQDPATQLDMLRKQMFAAGQDASSMNRQQIKLLASTTGLSEEVARQAFSMKNAGSSLDDIKKKSEAAEKKQLSQAEAMAKLADSIERLVIAGNIMHGGFFDRFFHGFLGGLQMTKEFRDIIFNLQRSLMLVEFAGIRLGRTFEAVFPGIRDIFGGLSQVFSPKHFSALFNGVTDEFIAFFKEISTGRFSFTKLMDNLKKRFFNFFDSSEGAGRRVLSGFRDTFTALGKIVGQGIMWVTDEVKTTILWITDILTGKKSLASPDTSGLGFIGKILEPVLDGLKYAWKQLAPVIDDLIDVLADKAIDAMRNIVLPKLVRFSPEIAVVLFGPAFMRGMMAMLTTTLGKGILSTVRAVFKQVLPGVQAQAQQVVKASQTVSAAAGPAAATKGLDQVAQINKAVGEVVHPTGAKDWGAKDAVKLGLKLIAIAGAIAVGGVMVAGSLALMHTIMERSGIKKPADVYPQLMALGAMVVGAVPLMLAMRLASKVGNAGEITKGGLVMSLAVGIVGLVSAGIAELLSLVDTSTLTVAGGFLLKMSLVFMAMVPLILASMAIGALASGPQAMLLAVAASGMGIIAGAVAEMATLSVDIIKQLSSLQVNADFQKKIDAFLGVMKSIQSFADTMVKMIGLMEPSFTDLIQGTTFVQKVNESIDVIEQMIGKRGSRNGLLGIMDTVMDQIKMIANYSGLSEASRIFSETLNSVTGIITAMTPPPEFYSAQTDFINILDPTIGRSLAETMKGYIQIMTSQVETIVTQVKSTVASFMKLDVPNTSKAQAVGTMLGSVVSLMKAIMPDPNAVKAFTNITEDKGGVFFTAKKWQTLDTAGMTNFMTMYASELSRLVPVLTSGVINSIINSTKDIDKEQIGKAKGIGDAFKVVVDLLNIVGGMMKGEAARVENVQPGAVINIVSQAPNIADILQNIAMAVPRVFDALKSAVSSMPRDKSFSRDIETARSMFSLFGDLTKFAQSLTDMSKGAPVGGVNTNPLIASVRQTADFFAMMSADETMTNMPSNIGVTALIMQNINSFLTPVVLADVKKAATNVVIYGKEMMKVGATFSDGGIKMALAAINDMVTQANALNDAMGKLPDLKLDAKLHTLAAGLGLGGKFNYQIKSKDVVMNITLNVEMNAADIEKSLILREKSIIRNRLNFATNEAPGKEATETLPATPTNFAYAPATVK